MKKLFSGMRLFMTACLLAAGLSSQAASLRRTISPSQPAWIIHIDVWNDADPQKIIDMVPEDVRPWVIFNIATSSSDAKSPDGPAIYDSWMTVCAQNRVWTMIQCASGFFNRMPNCTDDASLSAYEQYYKKYPNFLGFNFAEQYWGFDGTGDGAVSFDSRLALFAKLLTMARTYGGYLAVSFADSYYNANKMPVAYVKRNADINTFLNATPEHFLCFEKYTQKKNFLFNESQCLGAWLGGIAGQYGIRFDCSGWVEKGCTPDTLSASDATYTRGTSDYRRAAGVIPVIEHLMLTGQTVMDGPELSWTECSKEGATTTVDGFTRRNWQWTPQWEAVTLDVFRKVLDGTIRILSKDEVLARTKVCVVSGGSGTNNASYLTPSALFDGLYRNAADYGGLQDRTDNHWLDNRWWTKTTGRYPAIPTLPKAGTLTDIGSYLSSQETKVNYLNTLFPEEYTGDIYAARQENVWVTYNPYQYDDVTTDGVRTLAASTRRATGNIPFQYNTCTGVTLNYAPYSLGIMHEYAGKVTFYLQNYEGGKDTIRISGASAEPTYTANGGTVTQTWADNVFTLAVEHSGTPVELTVNCAGSETRTGTATEPVALTLAPALPALYKGDMQYEAELADYKVAVIRKEGYGLGHDGFKGQGYAEMPNNGKLRFRIKALAGYYNVKVRYQAAAGGTLIVNTDTLTLENATDWTLSAGVSLVMTDDTEQVIDIAFSGSQTAYVDCIVMELQAASVIDEADGTPAVIGSGLESASITYKRTLTPPTSESWDVVINTQNESTTANLYTVCLPYKPAVNEGVKFYTLNGMSGTSLDFGEVAETAENTPYLVAVTSGSHEIGSATETSIDFTTDIHDGDVKDGYQMKGTLRGLTHAEALGCYILQVGNVWRRVGDNESVYVPPFRAYIVTQGTGNARLSSTFGDLTGIRHIRTVDADGTERWYDLNGRRITNAGSGLRIGETGTKKMFILQK